MKSNQWLKQKFWLQCAQCGTRIADFRDWFRGRQQCLECRSGSVSVVYSKHPVVLEDLFSDLQRLRQTHNMWRYFEMLPVNNRDSIVTANEGAVPIDRWQFLETAAKNYFKVRCKVFAHRHDNNYATGSLKDLSASVAATVLRENGIENFVMASTGNMAVAHARYLAAAGIHAYSFIPEISTPFQEAEIACFGQTVFRVAGDYAGAKRMAAEFAIQNGLLHSAGSLDPMRIEAKKTMAYEWRLHLPKFPSVYIQAVSGGTGPLGIWKGCMEMLEAGLIPRMPRMILVQTSRCAPMTEAWTRARNEGFPKGWEEDYPRQPNPATEIPTLATGDPTVYPALAPKILQSGGQFVSFLEELAPIAARLVAFEQAVRMGPAASIAVGGFFQALKEGQIKDGDSVLINIGEGIRRDPPFLLKMINASRPVHGVEDCRLQRRDGQRDFLYRSILANLSGPPHPIGDGILYHPEARRMSLRKTSRGAVR
jgi:threonine synthase